jgi:acetolactate synthase-1/2/3 large subunit
MRRLGGHLVAETLQALGAEVVFGLPGVHALPIWEGLRASGLRTIVFRQELNAAFAADGYARVTGRPAPLVVSTGPGALMTLAALMEAAASSVPVVVISSQIASSDIGRGKGHLHEAPDQRASFAPLVKWCGRAASVEAIPDLVALAWRRALAAPSGPTYLELPTDLLAAPAGLPPPAPLAAEPEPPPLPPQALLDRAAALLARSRRPVIWAGGGVQRSGAWEEVRALARRLDAPVAETYTGKGVLAPDDPLLLGSGWEERAFLEELEAADTVLCVGSSLGYDSTDTFRLRLHGTLIHVDADPERIGRSYPALPLVGDAAAVLRALLERLPPLRAEGEGARRVASVRARIARGLADQGRPRERALLDLFARSLPPSMPQAWDSTILAYMAAAHLPAPAPRRFLYPAGSSTLGYAWPAALGAAAALPEGRCVAVVGDGGFLYAAGELATARQYGLDAALLLVDDGGYGILRQYQLEAGFEPFAVDLLQPDFAALCEACGVPARRSSLERLEADLAWALSGSGPAAVVLPVALEMLRPTE